MPQGFAGEGPRSTAQMHLRMPQTSRRLHGHVRMQILESRMGTTSLMVKKNQRKQTNKITTSFRKPQNFFFFFFCTILITLYTVEWSRPVSFTRNFKTKA